MAQTEVTVPQSEIGAYERALHNSPLDIQEVVERVLKVYLSCHLSLLQFCLLAALIVFTHTLVCLLLLHAIHFSGQCWFLIWYQC